MTVAEDHSGHRERLRRRFQADPTQLSEVELLELLLGYAIPRRDVAPQAQALLERFGDLSAVLSAPSDELVEVPGVGEAGATLIGVVGRMVGTERKRGETVPETAYQGTLFERDKPPEPPAGSVVRSNRTQMTVFANDGIAEALAFIPEAVRFSSLADFKAHLGERLPYNSALTRQRRARDVLRRYFPEQRLDVPLAYYAAHCASQDDLKPALFYHIMKAEPLAGKVAEEFVWPALPGGYVDREQMREFILRVLPDISASAQKNALRSIFYAYDLLGVGTAEGTTLRIQTHSGTLEGFLYVLMAEFPEPGMYSFEALEQGPLRHWLLWDREWMRRQLYNLRDYGVIAKVSEIDTVRQFTLQLGQQAALKRYFEHPDRGRMALREQPTE